MNIEELIRGIRNVKGDFSARSESEGSSSSGFGRGSDNVFEARDFTSGLKLPKIESEDSTGENGRRTDTDLKEKKKKLQDPKMKIRKIKELHKKPREITQESKDFEGDSQSLTTRSHTGLFNSSNAFYENDTSVNEDDDETTTKIKTFISKHKRNSKLDHEIQSRISQAYQKMGTLDKGIKAIDETFLAAKERAHRNKIGKTHKTLSETPTTSNSLLENLSAKTKYNKGKLRDINCDKQNPTNYAFGNDSEKKGELEERDSTEETGSNFSSTSSRIRELTQEVPLVKDKRFLAKLQRRGSKLNQEITGIKARLEAENTRNKKNDHIIGQKSKTFRTSKESFTPKENGVVPKQIGRLLLDYDPNKGPAKEFTEFLQSNGGLTGGWNKQEHNNFLKHYIKLKRSPTELIDTVAKSCPERSVEEIATHLQWYDKYLQLDASSKEYIRGWDVKKRKERQTMFEMAKEDHKAKLESERSHNELLKFKREQERIRQKDNLEAWKKAMGTKLQVSEVGEVTTVDEKLNKIDDVANSLFESKKKTQSLNAARFHEDMKAAKEKLIQILPKTHQAQKMLAKVGTSGPTIPRQRPLPLQLDPTKPKIEAGVLSRTGGWKDYMKPTSASLSSGIFSDYNEELKPKEIFTFQHGLGRGDTLSKTELISHSEVPKVVTGSGDAGLVETNSKLDVPAKKILMLGLAPPGRRGTNPQLVKMFQSRDAELVEARKLAIQHKKDKQKNKSNLSIDQVRERLTKLDVPSQIQQLTKGLKIRKSIKELEAIEAETRAVKRKDATEYHKLSRVATPQLFKTEKSIRNVSKLGVPAWRNV